MNIIIEGVARIRSNDLNNFEIVTRERSDTDIDVEHVVYVPIQATTMIQPDGSVLVET